jgi:hypothetical protein
MAMTAASDGTLRTTVDDIYNTEYISRQWRETARDPMFGIELAKVIDLPLEEANSLVYEVPIAAEMTGVAAITGVNAAPERRSPARCTACARS